MDVFFSSYPNHTTSKVLLVISGLRPVQVTTLPLNDPCLFPTSIFLPLFFGWLASLLYRKRQRQSHAVRYIMWFWILKWLILVWFPVPCLCSWICSPRPVKWVLAGVVVVPVYGHSGKNLVEGLLRGEQNVLLLFSYQTFLCLGMPSQYTLDMRLGQWERTAKKYGMVWYDLKY